MKFTEISFQDILNNPSQYTFALIKPDVTSRGLQGEVISLVMQNGFEIVNIKAGQVSEALAKTFYAEHAAKGFFTVLLTNITAGQVMPMILKKDNAVEQFRALLGHTDPIKSAPNTIRQKFGISIDHNSVHGSDSILRAITEIYLFFYQN